MDGNAGAHVPGGVSALAGTFRPKAAMGPTVTDHNIRTVEEYRALRGDAHQMNYDKSMTVIDEHISNFLAMSTFLTIASADAEGRMDVSPKGDPPGFVRVVDDTTIAIPEREGNRRADTFTNILPRTTTTTTSTRANSPAPTG